LASSFSGVKVVNVSSEKINTLYKEKEILLDKEEYPNLFIVFKNADSQSALTRVSQDGTIAKLISDKLSAGGIKPKNKEQTMALDMLLDDKVPVNIITGSSGSGKTILALAAALSKIESGKYKKIILSKPMSQVGEYELGILPGLLDEKFMPYLGNFQDNLIQLGGKDIEHLMERYNIECAPIQLMRGRSFVDTFIICDEVQVLNHHEMKTIGTRVGNGSKIVFLGDLKQIDSNIPKTSTGLYKTMNSQTAKESGMLGAIDLIKVERGPVCELFTNIFEE
jgi:PhoH-like ATPase